MREAVRRGSHRSDARDNWRRQWLKSLQAAISRRDGGLGLDIARGLEWVLGVKSLQIRFAVDQDRSCSGFRCGFSEVRVASVSAKLLTKSPGNLQS
jgi:hypothetical protein